MTKLFSIAISLVVPWFVGTTQLYAVGAACCDPSDGSCTACNLNCSNCGCDSSSFCVPTHGCGDAVLCCLPDGGGCLSTTSTCCTLAFGGSITSICDCPFITSEDKTNDPNGRVVATKGADSAKSMRSSGWALPSKPMLLSGATIMAALIVGMRLFARSNL